MGNVKLQRQSVNRIERMMEGALSIKFQWNQPRHPLFHNSSPRPLTLYKIGRFVTHETRKQNSLFFSFSILHKLYCSSYIHLNQYVCLLPPANRRRSCSNGCQAGSGSQRDFEALWSWNEQAEGDRFEGEAAGGGGGGGYGKRRSAGEIGWGR